MPWRRVLAAAVVVGAGCLVAIAASSDPPATLSIQTRDLSKDEIRMRVPARAEAGLVEITLHNRGDMLHDAQLFRVDGDRRAADVVNALEQSDNAPKPRWLHPAGGVAPTVPGERATVTLVLQPGTYYVADTQERVGKDGYGGLTNAAKDGIARIEVDGSTDDELPSTDATIEARDYGFETAGIRAGTNRVTFRNSGRELHQAVAFRIPDDTPFHKGKRAVIEQRAGTGWVPIDVPNQRATTVLDAGGEQIAELDFAPGRYVLFCFVADRAGGSPHWTLDMTSNLTVPAKEADTP